MMGYLLVIVDCVATATSISRHWTTSPFHHIIATYSAYHMIWEAYTLLVPAYMMYCGEIRGLADAHWVQRQMVQRMLTRCTTQPSIPDFRAAEVQCMNVSMIRRLSGLQGVNDVAREGCMVACHGEAWLHARRPQT